MIKRIIGWLFAIVTIGVVVFTMLNMGNYTTMCSCFDFGNNTPKESRGTIMSEEEDIEIVTDANQTIDTIETNDSHATAEQHAQ